MSTMMHGLTVHGLFGWARATEAPPLPRRDAGYSEGYFMDLDAPYAFFVTRAFNVPEIAETLGISVNQVLGHIQDGTLAAINVGRGATRRDLRVTDTGLENFVRAREVSPNPNKPLPRKMRLPTALQESSLAPDGYAARRAARRAKTEDRR